MDEWIWIKHPETGGVAYVTKSALDACWRDLGWEETSDPNDVDAAAPAAKLGTPTGTGDEPSPKATA